MLEPSSGQFGFIKLSVVLKFGVTESAVVLEISKVVKSLSPWSSPFILYKSVSVTRELVSLENLKLGSSSSLSKSGISSPLKAAAYLPGPTPKSTVSNADGTLIFFNVLTPEAWSLYWSLLLSCSVITASNESLKFSLKAGSHSKVVERLFVS